MPNYVRPDQGTRQVRDGVPSRIASKVPFLGVSVPFAHDWALVSKLTHTVPLFFESCWKDLGLKYVRWHHVPNTPQLVREHSWGQCRGHVDGTGALRSTIHVQSWQEKAFCSDEQRPGGSLLSQHMIIYWFSPARRESLKSVKLWISCIEADLLCILLVS